MEKMNAPEKIYISSKFDPASQWDNEKSPGDIEYIRKDLAMAWEKIEEAGLKHGEEVDILVGECRYKEMIFVKHPWDDAAPIFSGGGFYFDADQVTHIMRVKMPGEAVK